VPWVGRDGDDLRVGDRKLGTDLWVVGSWWGDRVAAPWERTVAASLESIAVEAERRAR
jgi:hypothetical protein